MKHPYAEILHAIADGKRVQFKYPSDPEWHNESNALLEIYDGTFHANFYRIHPDDVEPATDESSVADALVAVTDNLVAQLEAERIARQEAQRQLADLHELQAKSGLAHRKAVQEAVAEAVNAAREACAKECESRHANGNRKYTHADECAAGIRSMGNE